MSVEELVNCESKVTQTSVIPSDARKSVQWAAVRNTLGAISVPEQSTSFSLGCTYSAIRAPTSGCRLPSSCPLTIAPAGPAYNNTAASNDASAKIPRFITPSSLAPCPRKPHHLGTPSVPRCSRSRPPHPSGTNSHPAFPGLWGKETRFQAARWVGGRSVVVTPPGLMIPGNCPSGSGSWLARKLVADLRLL